MTLTARRQQIGLTIADLATDTGLSWRTIYRLMGENRLPNSTCAREALAKALKVDLAGLSALVAKPAKRGALAGVGRGVSRRAHEANSTVRGGR
jgi:transcriptional regulator with XRE-family HTH domain